jgi:hypothetical protein
MALLGMGRQENNMWRGTMKPGRQTWEEGAIEMAWEEGQAFKHASTKPQDKHWR